MLHRAPARLGPLSSRYSRRSILKGLGVAPLAALAGGCGATDYVSSLFASTPGASTVTWTLKTTPGVNPDISERPSPIWVRLYQLRSTGVFGGADFVALFDRDIDVLGAEMLDRHEYVMVPHQTLGLQDPVTLHEDTRFIGVVGAYHDISRAHWREWVEVKPLDEHYTLTVDLERVALRMKLDKA